MNNNPLSMSIEWAFQNAELAARFAVLLAVICLGIARWREWRLSKERRLSQEEQRALRYLERAENDDSKPVWIEVGPYDARPEAAAMMRFRASDHSALTYIVDVPSVPIFVKHAAVLLAQRGWSVKGSALRISAEPFSVRDAHTPNTQRRLQAAS